MISLTRHILKGCDLAYYLSRRDFSDPIEGTHCFSLIIQKMKEIFESQKKYTTVEVRRGEKVSDVSREFDSLFYPMGSYIRALDYGRYLDTSRLLRTHMTPLAVDIMKESVSQGCGQSLFILPGICFRREVIQKNRINEPHKIDFLILRKGKPLLTTQDLDSEVDTFVKSVQADLNYRSTKAVHPFTKYGLSVEVVTSENNWLKILECGIASDELLRSCGLNPETDSAILMGAGLERLVMVAKRIDDMRVLYCSNQRVSSQMQNLDEFSAPFTSKLFSQAVDIIVPTNWSLVDVSDNLRESMGERVMDIESLEVVSESPLKDNQKNMKLQVTISSVCEELTDEDATEIATKIKITNDQE